MRVHIKRLCLGLMYIWGIALFMYIAKFNNHNKFKTYFGKHLTDIEKTANSHAAKLLTSDRTNDYVVQTPKGSHGTTSKIDDITRSKYLASPKFRQIQKAKQNEKFEAKNKGGLCNLTIFHADLETRANTWQQVDMKKSMYVFSAYYTQSKVYIIGVKPRKSVRVICQLWSWDVNGYLTVTQETMATETAMPDGYNQTFASTIYKCSINHPDIPAYVSMVIESCDSPLNLIRVHDVATVQYNAQFTVCLSPLNFRYGRAYELVEWIELNKILGADKFVIYNYSSAVNVAQVLDYYTKRNTTEVIQWQLPMGVDTFPKTNQIVEIHYFGQTAALNDCLFRNKKLSEYVVNLDVDEFIIPHSKHTNNWNDIINQQGKFSVYLFKNTFFRKDWGKLDIPFDSKKLADEFRLVTLQVFHHEAKIFPGKLRSKYIAKTADIDYMLVHEVPRSRWVTVPANISLLHHYRNWENPKDKLQRVTDTTVMEKFRTLLTKNVQKVWKDLSHVKMDIPIT